MRTISSWHKDPTRCDVTFSLHGTEIRCRLASQSFSYLQLGYIEQLPDCTWRRACRPSNGYQYRLILQGRYGASNGRGQAAAIVPLPVCF
eukprot:COSAG03_NODE_166_length_11291_cov_15.762866_8_plen_90_part_00